jgi:6-phosphogluconolactonase (cycloisomerase 2 family)
MRSGHSKSYSSQDHLRHSVRLSVLWSVVGLLVSCGGGDGGGGGNPVTYTISATVAGLQAGKSVVLLNNGTDRLVVSANGTIAFATPIPTGRGYSVTVGTQPTGQTCAASQGTGTVSSFNINVAVGCSANAYTVSGTVSGLLTGNSVVLQNNRADVTPISANGPFKFGSTILSGSAYSVTVSVQPPGENCTIANGSGTVAGSNVSNISVTCTLLAYTIGVTVLGRSNIAGLVLQDNGKDDLALTASGAYQFQTPLSNGSSYAVTILTQPTGHTCVVTNPNGIVTNGNVSVTVICPASILYGTNSTQIYAYYIDESSGSLTAVPGSPYPGGTQPTRIDLAPNGKFLYVIDSGGNAVLGYSIDPISGALAGIAGSPYLVASSPTSITTTPDGSLILVLTGGSQNVTSFAVNPLSGTLSQTAISPYSVDPGATTIITEATGKFAYTANRSASTVSGYSIKYTTGALTPIVGGTYSFPDPIYLQAYPQGGFLYILNFVTANLYVDTIDSNTGALGAITGSPYLEGQSTALSIDSTGRYLYIAAAFNGDVLGDSINPTTGALTPMAGSPFLFETGGNMPTFIALDPSGKFAYVINNGAIVAFAIDAATGALAVIGGTGASAGYVAIGTIQ